MSTSLPGGWFESGHGAITIFVKDFRDPLQRKKKLILRPWASIKDVKDQLQVVFNVPTNAQKLYYQGRELKNAHNLQQCGIYQDNAIVDFVARRQQNLAMMYAPPIAPVVDVPVKKNVFVPRIQRQHQASLANAQPSTDGSSNLRPHQMPVMSIHPFGAHVLPISLLKIVHQALQGLALGLAPTLAMDGTGGTYFLRDPSHRNVGCFKPQDEEPFGPNNPRGLIGQLGQSGLRRGILSGEACEREVAAYLLDKDHFAGVPATALVEARHPAFHYDRQHAKTTNQSFKMGSLQEFVKHDDVVSDLAPSQFHAHQVHKIVLLDMRLLNTDRNDANILVRKKRTTAGVEYDLIPIDHGYCLPHFLEIAWCDWCWFEWPQLQIPLSKEDRNYILALNPTEEIEWLSRKIPLRRACRRNFLIANLWIQKSVRANVLLVEIARVMCREDLDAPSQLETMCLEAFAQVVQQRKSPIKNHQLDNLTAPSSPRKLTIEIPPFDENEEEDEDSQSQQSGNRSPPGFWASYNPFKTTVNGRAKDPWDLMASNALNSACHQVEAEPNHKKSSIRSDMLTDEAQKDEFEQLNEALDDNLQEEKLFFILLGRLMDDQLASFTQ